MDGNGASGRPLVDSRFQVWEFPKRAVQREGPLSSVIGVRLGAQASGESGNYVESVPNNPSAQREPSVRELMDFLHARRHIGPPPPSRPGWTRTHRWASRVRGIEERASR